MKTHQIQLATAVLSSVFSIPFVSEGKPKLQNKPNVVIILTDDMGYGDISCYNQNQIKTPNIDRLATEGVRFTNFYVPTPYCAPSRASLLTEGFHFVIEW